MESENSIVERIAAEPKSGHFRILFIGYRAKPVSDTMADIAPTSESQSAAAATSAWNTPEDEDRKAYFQADISLINLGGNDTPKTSVLTAMITGDVRGLGKPPGWKGPGYAKIPEWLPLSLGTYALAPHANAITIGGFTIEREYIPIRPGLSAIREGGAAITAQESGLRDILEGPCRRSEPGTGRDRLFDLPLRRINRNKVIFLTYESADALAKTDQGFGMGVFPIECRDPYDSGLEYTLYFGIERH